MRYLSGAWGALTAVVVAGVLTACAAGKQGTSSGATGTGGAGTGGAQMTGSASGMGGMGTSSMSSTQTGFSVGSSTSTGMCPTAQTCAQANANCGPVSDGCGGVQDCGTCPAGQTCGGGGTPSQCGTPPCVAKTCAQLNLMCGPAGDGCGNQIDCGTCPTGQTCGGGGAGKCGGAMCTPKTCAQQSIGCGPAGDGCGGMLDCGTCPTGQTCGGGGVPSQCGAPMCTPKTCASIGAATCGPVADGCGGLLMCGACTTPQTCGGGGVANQCGIPNTCTGLCLQQTTCPGGGTTSLTGTVYAPNGTDPLPNVLVYVPNAPVAAFTPGVACDKCSAGVSGKPLVFAATDTAGHFTITNMPVGSNIPLVIQTGRWRRQVTISTITACTSNAAPAALTRLPKNKTEGDIPHIAFVTGAVDVLECVMRKVGVDDTEFTQPSGTGRINLFVGDGQVQVAPGPNGKVNVGGANAGAGTPSEPTLVDNPATLAQYDMVLFPCKGAPIARTTAEQTNLINYANAGGRVFATHFSYEWLYNDPPFQGTHNWNPNQCSTSLNNCPADQIGYINTTFPKGLELSQWLVNIGVSTTPGQVPTLNTLRVDTNWPAVVAPTQEWVSVNDATRGNLLMHSTFNTPVGATPDQQCGRVLFDDFHVENHGFINQGSAYGMTFPAECTAGAMTPQEKLLEFMIFDLGSCVTPDIPMCTPKTCAQQNIGCGPAGDGCGNVIQCGTCPTGQTCGGGGVPSQCGAPTCTPKTCMQLGLQCGPAGNGCGGQLNCGTCPAGQTCGGGGMPGVCGSGTCTPLTCAGQGIQCGPAGDGCGNLLQCGTCPAGQTCGGGGMPGKCGTMCTPQTCTQLGFNCGTVGDGCGGSMNCGTCSAPQTCGGGGTPNVCGGSIPM